MFAANVLIKITIDPRKEGQNFDFVLRVRVRVRV
jgi:hypothetical protein